MYCISRSVLLFCFIENRRIVFFFGAFLFQIRQFNPFVIAVSLEPVVPLAGVSPFLLTNEAPIVLALCAVHVRAAAQPLGWSRTFGTGLADLADQQVILIHTI